MIFRKYYKRRSYMTEKKLRYFIMAAECENISKAADRLYIAQPALSKVISGMEEELGYSLFDRIGKRIVLNQNGTIFYQYAREIVNHYENMRASLAELNHKQVRSLCVGVGAASQLLPSLLQQFQKTNIDEKGQIQIKASYPLDFMRDNIDLMIGSDLQKKEEAGKEYLLSEQILLALPKGHPLGKKKKIYLEDTLEYDYVLPSGNTCLGRILNQFFEESTFHYPENATYTNNSYVQCELAGQGLGISFMPEKSWVYARKLEQIILRPLEDVTLQRNIFFQYHPNKYRNEMMKRFGGFLKLYFKELNDNKRNYLNTF